MTDTSDKPWERRLADELRLWLAPIVDTEGDPSRVLALLEATGWRVKGLKPREQQALALAFAEVVTAANVVLDALASPPRKLERFLLDVGPKLVEALSAIPGLASALPPGLPVPGSELSGDLLNWLTIGWLRRYHRTVYAGLRLLGVIQTLPYENQSAGGVVLRTKNSVPRFSEAQIVRLFENPGGVVKEAFWSSDVSDADGALAVALELWAFAHSIGLAGSISPHDPDEEVDPGATHFIATERSTVRVSKSVPLSNDTDAEVGVVVERIPKHDGGPGALVAPFGEWSGSYDLGAATLELAATGGASTIRIDAEGVKLVAGGQEDASFAVGLMRGSQDSPALSLGDEGGFQLELQTVAVRGSVRVGPTWTGATIALELIELAFTLALDEADSFLGKLVPLASIAGNASVVGEWTSDGGLSFRGSGGLSITIPLHLTVGPVTVEGLTIDVGVGGASLPIGVGATLSGELGPMSVALDRVGLLATLRFPDGGGNLGPMDASLSFLPPTGAGLALNAGPLVGGGFLEFDPDNERYSGILSLCIGEIAVVAIGLITTKLPDGKKGFSLLVNIGVTFDPPFQLSMGFTLSGVGGLVGINRSMDLEALQRGVKQRTLDSILFPDPDKVIVNASEIISDMRSVFPPVDGRFVIGPMVKLGWGSPNIITADIGIFLELPDPVRVVLMGQLKAALPKPEAALVVINLDVLGVLDLEKQELTFQASLYDSRILAYSLAGDAAFLLNWGDRPQFGMAMGGFHPKFPTPSPAIIFADLRRLSVSISSGKSFKLSCRAYHAITANSVQFGARVDLYASAAGATVKGHMGFDALFYFSPFSFEVGISAGVSIRVSGISLADVRLSLVLSGPTPWVARGKARVKIAFFPAIKVRFCIKWGPRKKQSLPAVDPWVPLAAALAAPESWGTVLPTGRDLVESMRPQEPQDEPQLVVHPVGRFEVRQNVVPLGLKLSKLGNSPVKDHDLFRVESLTVGTQTLTTSPVKEFFSRGQFENLSRSKKLSTPSFEKLQAGVTTAASEVVLLNGTTEEGSLAYESILIHADLTAETAPEPGSLEWEDAEMLAAADAKRAARNRASPRRRYSPAAKQPKVEVLDEGYAIVTAATLERAELAEGVVGENADLTLVEAEQLLQQHDALALGTAGELVIVLEFEVVEQAA